jgi:3-oxoisoapionate kinase
VTYNASQPTLLYAWYGDDFTGATDVLEALAVHGVPAVLFTRTPGERDIASFAHCRAIGIAGESRSRSPEWMSENLPAVFSAMRGLNAPVNHYKVCSTFDSSPQTGSIGRAIELGGKTFESHWIPVVAAAPRLGRFVLLANLFAESQGEIYRIDRHPTMQHHPVTPMDEADLRLHLARQTDIPLGSVDLRAFSSGRAEQKLGSELADGARAIVFDGLDAAMLQETASLIWRSAADQPIFAVGSSGLTHGLLNHWRALGCIGGMPLLPTAAPADRLLVLSGSCSPVTAQQIDIARGQGFAAFHVNGASQWMTQTDKAVSALARGKSVVLYTALGSADHSGNFGEENSRALGEMLHEILLRSRVGRIVIAGGDTASHAVSQLGLNALTFAAPIAPGAPLCRAYAPGSALDGLELVLKGGQIGSDNFFSMVRDGA